jgi:hypothetical protein
MLVVTPLPCVLHSAQVCHLLLNSATHTSMPHTEIHLSTAPHHPTSPRHHYFHTFLGLRLGLYSPIKDALAAVGTSAPAGGAAAAGPSSPGPPLSFMGKMAAGSLSGGLAAAITNPTELVKVSEQPWDLGGLCAAHHAPARTVIMGLAAAITNSTELVKIREWRRGNFGVWGM